MPPFDDIGKRIETPAESQRRRELKKRMKLNPIRRKEWHLPRISSSGGKEAISRRGDQPILRRRFAENISVNPSSQAG